MIPPQTQPDTSEAMETLHQLSAVNNGSTLVKTSYILLGFAGTLIFAHFFFTTEAGLLLLIAGVCAATWTQLAIIEELHDGYHYRLLSPRRANEILTGLYASSVGISVAYARAAHNRHHRYFGTPDDPDYPIYSQCPAGVKAWLTYIAVHFSGYGAVRGLVKRQGIATGGKPDLQHPVETILVQLALLALYWMLVHPAAYFIFWFIPLFTLTYGIGHFRTKVDHWTPEPWTDPRQGKTFAGALYNFEGIFQRHIIGAQFGYNYHGMHHLAPSIPNYNLDKAVDSDYLCPPELVRTTTYYARLKEMLLNGYRRGDPLQT